jgi:hypothetical protein
MKRSVVRVHAHPPLTVYRMNFFERLIIGVPIIYGGYLLMRYTVQITEYTGRVDFAEEYLRGFGAGTYTMWRIIGVLAIVGSLLWIFGLSSIIGKPVASTISGNSTQVQQPAQ